MNSPKKEASKWRAFRSARKFARRLGLRCADAWRRYCYGDMKDKPRKPDDIPRNPWIVYRERDWKDIGDWLGCHITLSTHWRKFSVAREFARTLGIRTSDEWYAAHKQGKIPNDIPCAPFAIYRDRGWQDWGDWLATGVHHHHRYRPFRKARAFARSLHLRTRDEWTRFCKGLKPDKGSRPDDVPAKPWVVYHQAGWRGMGDWLGTGTVANFLKQFRPFAKARAFARSLRLRSVTEWRRYWRGLMPKKRRRPRDIPSSPDRTYRSAGWQGLGDWLGTGTVATRLMQFQPFVKARSFARSLALRSQAEWRMYCKGHLRGKGRKPADIPSDPWDVYRGRGWSGLGDWLGTRRARKPTARPAAGRRHDGRAIC